MKAAITLKTGTIKYINNFEKILYPGYDSIITISKEKIDTFFLDNNSYLFVGNNTLSIDGSQILTVEFI